MATCPGAATPRSRRVGVNQDDDRVEERVVEARGLRFTALGRRRVDDAVIGRERPVGVGGKEEERCAHHDQREENECGGAEHAAGSRVACPGGGDQWIGPAAPDRRRVRSAARVAA